MSAPGITLEKTISACIRFGDVFAPKTKRGGTSARWRYFVFLQPNADAVTLRSLDVYGGHEREEDHIDVSISELLTKWERTRENHCGMVVWVAPKESRA